MMVSSSSDLYVHIHTATSFHAVALESYLPVFIETAGILCDKFATKANTTFDIHEDLALQALDTILQVHDVCVHIVSH